MGAVKKGIEWGGIGAALLALLLIGYVVFRLFGTEMRSSECEQACEAMQATYVADTRYGCVCNGPNGRFALQRER